MKSSIKRLCVVLALTISCSGQATVQELNRAYVVEGTSLYAINSGGGTAWSTSLPGIEHSAWHPCLDPVREVVWLVEQTTLTLRRYSLQGNLELAIPISGPFGSLLKSPAVDRDGNCYLGRSLPDFGPNALDSYRSWLMKFDPQGTVLWDVEITPTSGLQTPGSGFPRLFERLRIDEDQNIWVSFTSERIIKLDPQGNQLFHFFTFNLDFSLNPDRSLWHIVRDTNAVPSFTLEKLSLAGSTTVLVPTFSPGTYLLSLASSGLLYWDIPSGATPLNYPLRSALCPTSDPSLGYPHLSCGEFGLGDPERLGDVRALSLSPDGTRLVAYGLKHDPLYVPFQPRLVEYGPFQEIPSPPGYPVASFTDLGSQPLVNSTGFNNSGSRFTAYDYCLIVDPWGDVDRDGCLNRNEIMAGTNPCDPASHQASLGLLAFQPGAPVNFQLDAPGDPGAGYLSVLSLNPHPVRLFDHRLFGPSPFEPDLITPLWLDPNLVTGAIGTLDTSGQATISTALPADPQLLGLELQLGFGTLDPTWSQGIKSLFGPVKITIGTPGFSL